MNEPSAAHDEPDVAARTYHRLEVAAVLLLVVGTVVYHLLEDWSWVDSLYFSTVTLTTVGFGDLAPTSDASKLFTVLYVLSGVSILITYLNARIQRRARRTPHRP